MLQTDFWEVYDHAAFSLVHIDTDNASAAALHAHWDQYNPTFPVLVGCGSLYSQYGDGYIPYNVILDTEGIVRYTDSGFSENTMHNIIDQYMSIDFPALSINEVVFVSDDNGDGRPDGGETVEYELSLMNSPIGVAATNIEVTMSCDDPAVTVLNDYSTFPDADPGDVVTGDDLFSYSVAEGIEPHWATFTFSYSADYTPRETITGDLDYMQRMGRPDLLLVDSDGSADDNEDWAVNALTDELGLEHDVWSGTVDGALAEEEMLRYEQIIWLGGRNEFDISASEAEGLAAFMDRGGLVLLSSQYALDNEDNADFFADYFGVGLVDDDGGSIFVVESEDGDEYFDGIAFVLTGSGGANNNEEPDVIEVTGDGVQFMHWTQGEGGPAAAYEVGETYNAVFAGFPIEAMRLHGSVPESILLHQFFSLVFDFHAANSGVEESTATAESFRILEAYPNPFNPSTHIIYEMVRGADASLAVFNTLGQQVTRLEQGFRPAGVHEVLFDAGALASGVYLVELQVEDEARDVARITLLK